MAMIITDDQNYKDIAEAIREKNGEEAQYKSNEMANAVRALSSLNFEVVGGTTQPENPKKNTIWVNTDQEITAWSFSATEPKEPCEGMAWFPLLHSANAVFNAANENQLLIYPSAPYQYIDGAWVGVGASAYIGNEWISVDAVPFYTYTGSSEMITEGRNWKLRFLTSGTLTFSRLRTNIDVFLVGGGGGSTRSGGGLSGNGGGGGYTKTSKSINLEENVSYDIVVGAGGSAGSVSGTGDGGYGGSSSAFGLSVSGGAGGIYKTGAGSGGSGGNGYNSNAGSATDGANGYAGSHPGGYGQGTTTREFGESNGQLYSSGGATNGSACAGAPNTGNGGGYYGSTNHNGNAGGSGIVIIRNSR